jgi:hypothetical protein
MPNEKPPQKPVKTRQIAKPDSVNNPKDQESSHERMIELNRRRITEEEHRKYPQGRWGSSKALSA